MMFNPKRWYDFDPVIQEVVNRLSETLPTYRSIVGNRMNHLLLERYAYVLDRGKRVLSQKSWNALSKRTNLSTDIWSSIELWQFLNEDQLMDVVRDTLLMLNDLEKDQWNFISSQSAMPTYTIYPHAHTKTPPLIREGVLTLN